MFEVFFFFNAFLFKRNFLWKGKSRFKELKVACAVWRKGWKKRGSYSTKSGIVCAQLLCVFVEEVAGHFHFLCLSSWILQVSLSLFSPQTPAKFHAVLGRAVMMFSVFFLVSAAKFSLCCDKKLC